MKGILSNKSINIGLSSCPPFFQFFCFWLCPLTHVYKNGETRSQNKVQIFLVIVFAHLLLVPPEHKPPHFPDREDKTSQTGTRGEGSTPASPCPISLVPDGGTCQVVLWVSCTSIWKEVGPRGYSRGVEEMAWVGRGVKILSLIWDPWWSFQARGAAAIGQ